MFYGILSKEQDFWLLAGDAAEFNSGYAGHPTAGGACPL